MDNLSLNKRRKQGREYIARVYRHHGWGVKPRRSRAGGAVLSKALHAWCRWWATPKGAVDLCKVLPCTRQARIRDALCRGREAFRKGDGKAALVEGAHAPRLFTFCGCFLYKYGECGALRQRQRRRLILTRDVGACGKEWEWRGRSSSSDRDVANLDLSMVFAS